jgi:hypothetical protein
MFPEWGSWTRSASTRRSTTTAGFIASAANPYAAMPSLHAMDALIVGIVMFRARALEAREGAVARVAAVGGVSP